MAQRLDEIVVIDVEATCWQGPPPPGEQQEIIEIGVCRLEVPTLARGARDSLLVRPTRSTVSPDCTALTTLTAQQEGTGVPPAGRVGPGRRSAEAAAALASGHGTRQRAWASWGDFDRRIFEQQCVREEV